MKAIRPAFSNFMKKGQGSGGGSKPDVNIKEKEKAVGIGRMNHSLENQNKNVLNQLD